MNVAAAIVARDATLPLADLLGAKLVAAVGRSLAWRETGDSPDRPGWLARFHDWQQNDPAGASLTDELARIEDRLAAADDGRMRKRLLGLFRLSAAEKDLLDCALALAASPAFSEALERLRPGASVVLTERVASEIFGHPAQPIVRPSSPLAVWALVEQGVHHPRFGRSISADPDIAAAVFGRPGLDRCLAGCASVAEREVLPIDGWPVDQIAGEAARLIEMNQPVRIVLRAAPGSGRLQFACAVAEALGSKILCVSASGAENESGLYMRAQRLALLTGHALFWDSPPPSGSPLVTSAPVQFVAIEESEWLQPRSSLLDVLVDLPRLTTRERQAVWRSVSAHSGADELSDSMLSGARVGDLLASARHAPRSSAEALKLLRARVRGRLERAGNLLSQPYGWADLVLPDRQIGLLRTIVDEIRSREQLLHTDDRLAKYGGLGQSALLHGPPGTGKTMVAQILARELQVPLVRVDCASAVSKFIGETAKNLRSIFDCAGGSGALLFFDECDSLFARRTEIKDAHDRHANADTNYLLQLIESFDGAALLATNKKDNVDPAFIRRLRHVVDFPAPGPKERQALWLRHIAALSDARLPASKVAAWAESLSHLDLSPAQIKGAALTAAFLRVSAKRDAPKFSDLLSGVERELAKDGRGLDRQLRERMARHD